MTSNELWPAYRCLRVLAIARPLDEWELQAERRVGANLQACLGLPAGEAVRQARRWILLRREMLLHEVLAAQMEAPGMVELVRAIEIVAPSSPGVFERTLFVSLHYSVYSTLPWLKLAEVVSPRAAGGLRVLFDSGLDRRWRFPRADRLAELSRAGLLAGSTAQLVDRALQGPSAAARDLVRHLKMGGSAFLLFDAALAGRERHAFEVRIGAARASFPSGATWLARASGAHLVPTWIEPRDDGYVLQLGEPVTPRADAQELNQAIQLMVDRTILRRPGLWEGWLRIPTLGSQLSAPSETGS